MNAPGKSELPINYSNMPELERVNALNGKNPLTENNALTANKPLTANKSLNGKNPLTENNALTAKNEFTAEMIYERLRLKYDFSYGIVTTIFAPGKNSKNNKNALNDINTIYSGRRIYTQLTLACAKLEFDLIEKIIALGADVNLSPLNYYLDNRDEAYEKDEGLVVFHNTPLYELIKAMINTYYTSEIPDLENSFKNTIKLFISKNAKFTFNIPYGLMDYRKFGHGIVFNDKENSFDFYTKDLEIPLKFLLYINYSTRYITNTKDVSASKDIYILICQAFAEDDSPNKDDAKKDFLEGNLGVLEKLEESLGSTFLQNYSMDLLFKNSECESKSKGGSRRRKNRKNSKKRNARRSKSLTRRV